MRVAIKYTKGDRVKYISHLDFMRLMQRTLRRAHIPVAYSQGFNPHPRLSFASALAVGISSEGEYMDIYLERYVDPDLLASRINEKLPQGIEIIKCVEVLGEVPSFMSLIERAKYRISMSSDIFGDNRDISTLLKGFLLQSEIQVTRINRRGSRQIDIRQLIHSIDIIAQEDDIIMETVLSTGSRANLRPELLVGALLDYVGISTKPGGLQAKIHRLDLYFFQKGRWLTPIEMG